jgi:hypothetical protein
MKKIRPTTKVVELICEHCEDIFEKRACELPPSAGGTNDTTNATGRFCSKQCYWEWKVGKPNELH